MTDKERKIIHERLYGTFKKYQGLEPENIKKELNDKFCQHFTVDIIQNHQYSIDLLKQTIEEKNEEDVEYMINIILHFGYFNEICLIVAPLLIEPWHHMHDMIAMNLEFEENPNTVEYLYKGAKYRCENLDYESDYCEFNRKCIWGLWKIGTKEAIEKIKNLTNCTNEIIRNHAINMLNGKG